MSQGFAKKLRLIFSRDKVDVTGSSVSVSSSALPTGAATEAKQDTGNSSLAAILAKIIAAPATEAKQDTIITALGNMLAEMRDDVFVTAIYWEDRSSTTAVFYREERIRSQDDGSITTVYTRLSDNTVVGVLPAGCVLVQGANDRQTESFRYKAIGSTVDYSPGDWLTNVIIYDTDGNGTVLSSTWYNLSSGSGISAPTGSDIQAENETLLAAIQALISTTNTQIGATNEAAAGSDTATSGLNGLIKRVLKHQTDVEAITASVRDGIGSTSETAAASDTATSGLNGLFKRLLQRVTTFITTLTDGSQKAIVRGGAKGSTTAADVTSTAGGSNRQMLDVILRDSSGNEASIGGGGGGTGTTVVDDIGVMVKQSLDMLRHPPYMGPTGHVRVEIGANGQAVTVSSGTLNIAGMGSAAIDQSFTAWQNNNINFQLYKNRVYGY